MAGRGFIFGGLSGRLLVLTILYVMASGALIFLPAMGLKEQEILDGHILSAELSILPFTVPGREWPEDLRESLLRHANADEVLLRRWFQRDYFQIGLPHSEIDRTIDLSGSDLWHATGEALNCLLTGGNRTLHITSSTNIKDATSISIVLSEAPIRAELTTYAWRVAAAAAFISGLTGALVYFSLYLVVVRPMRRLTGAMGRFHENPEDGGRIHVPSRRADEIGRAERELSAMQKDIFGLLRQKARLAAIGEAVARIQHDLRNILANAQMVSDRLAGSDDPQVQKLAPRLVASLDRAIHLASTTLRYGRAEDTPPVKTVFPLRALVDEAAATAMEGHADGICHFDNAIDAALTVSADRDQIFRIVLNLLRNACEAMQGKGSLTVTAAPQTTLLLIDIADSGPGICEKVQEKLFQPFVSSARHEGSKPGGSGLGLAIARDLARAHGGDLALLSTGMNGTIFRLTLPVM